MAKKSLETRLLEDANDLLKEEYDISNDNDDAEVLVKEMALLRKLIEQVVFMLKKYKKKNK